MYSREEVVGLGGMEKCYALLRVSEQASPPTDPRRFVRAGSTLAGKDEQRTRMHRHRGIWCLSSHIEPASG